MTGPSGPTHPEPTGPPRLYSGPGRHRCPKPGCSIVIPDRLMACAPHWLELSPETRALVYQTRRLNLLQDRRREAMERMFTEWGQR